MAEASAGEWVGDGDDGQTAVSVWRSLNPFAARRYSLISRYPPAECASRLRDQAVKWRFPQNFVVRPSEGRISGRISDTGFMVVRYRRWRRNSFRPVASGTFRPDGTGTRVDLRIGLSPFIAIFLVAWAGLFLTFGTLPWLLALASSPARPDAWAFPGPVFAAVPLLGIAMLLFGQWWARDEAAFLLDLFRETLDARDAGDTPEPV